MFSTLKPVLGEHGSAFEKISSEIFTNSGLNAYWNYTFIRDPIKEGITTASNFMNDVESYSPNTYSNLGTGIGMTATTLGSSVMMGHMLYSGARNTRIAKDAIEAYRSGGMFNRSYFTANGGVMTSYSKGFKGGFLKTGSAFTGEKYIAEQIASKGVKKGFMNVAKGTFKTPSMGMGWNLALTAGVVAAGMIGTMALGTAGKWIDRASSYDLDRKRMHYDNREFYGVNRYMGEMSDTYNQTLNTYESKLFSLGRAYHSRG